MPILNNQVNKLWFNPTYNKFKRNGFSKQLFASDDSEDFLRTGAYLIEEAKRYGNTHIPWDENRRYEILINPRLENALLSIGIEYLLKGVFLAKGYAINLPKENIKLTHPVLIKGNISKLRDNEVQDLSYIKDHISKIIDFNEFNNNQQIKEAKAKKELSGEGVKGLTRLTIPFPNSQQLLDYFHFKRNYSLHRPFIIPEFVGIVRYEHELLDYIAIKSTGRSIKQLTKLTTD
jgi:hypothetical protein